MDKQTIERTLFDCERQLRRDLEKMESGSSGEKLIIIDIENIVVARKMIKDFSKLKDILTNR